MEIAANTKIQFPIPHWSYSSMLLFLKNPAAFMKQYILKIYDSKTSPAAVAGSACHAALAAYWENRLLSMDRIIEMGLASISATQDSKIEFGKTGSRENIIADYIQGVNFYFQELPDVSEVLGVEKAMTHFITLDGAELALPIKVKTDLIERDEQDRIRIRDHKFVSKYSDPDKDKAEFILQAMFNFHAVKKEFGEAPYSIIFDELKLSKNKDGSPQRQPYEIIFDQHPDFQSFFFQIYNDCTEEVGRPDRKYLPNIADMFTGQESFEEYKNKIITVVAPQQISHRTGLPAYVDKKFVPSTADVVDNQYFTNEEKIRSKLLEFGVAVEMGETFVGPNITLYTMKPSRGTKMSSFDSHAKDLAIALKAKTIRVEAPIMGTGTIGVEIPNVERTVVKWEEKFLQPGTMNIPIGINVHNEIVYKDLADMPHLLVAGSTGAGKSVMMNVIITSLAGQNDPSKLKLILIDPKRVELSQFKHLPHLMSKVIYEEKEAVKTINWLVERMELRYERLEAFGCRSIDEYNQKSPETMTKIVVVIDEFADLMLQAQSKGDTDIGVEKLIVRLAQKARATGIHLVLGTQRPSVDVVTGLIKANCPTRIAFMTASQVDSRIILDQSGAEELIGRGDLLFLDPHTKGVQRLQGLLV